MKIIKKIIIMLLLLSLTAGAVALVAYAHPGKTDSSGGHTDHSTGEYHYHHGYSAHDHYDMDGDGDVDCPYDFDDNTSHGGNSSGSSSKTSSKKRYSSDSYNAPSVSSISDKTEVKEVPAWVYWVFGGLSFLIIILFVSNSSKSDTIAEMKQRHKAEIDTLVKSCNAKIAEKQASDAELERIKSAIAAAKITEKNLFHDISSERKEILNIRRMRCFAREAPLDVSFSEDGMPVYWKPRLEKPYGDYTVYVSLNSKIYHTDFFCSGYLAKKDHIFNVIGHARPCKKCAVGFFDFTSAPDWYIQKESIFDNPSLKINWRK